MNNPSVPSDVTTLISTARENKWQKRWEAIHQLVKIGKPAVLPLIDLLHDEDMEAKSFGVDCLGRLKDQRAIDPLLKLLDEENDLLRFDVILALGNLGYTEIFDQVSEFLTNKGNPAQLRIDAAEALGNMRDERAIEPMTKVFLDSTDNASTLDDEIVRQCVTTALSQFGKRMLPLFLEALNNPDWRTRWFAADGLRDLGDTSAVEPLIAATKDPNNSVRRQIIYALRSFNDPRAYDVYLAALKDDDHLVCSVASLSLAKLGDKRAFEPLLEKLNDKSRLTRSAVVEALGILGDRRAVEVLIPILKDAHYKIRREAAKALGSIGDVQVIPYLEDLIASETSTNWYSDWIRSAAEWAIKRIQRREEN